LGLQNTHPHLIEKKESLNHDVVYTDYIGERIGSIRDYYSLLSPPIGKGQEFLELFLIPLIGAFGEVRRAIHLQTNVTRAVKIIKKSLTSKEQQEVLINEFNMLKMIVIRLLFLLLSNQSIHRIIQMS